MYGSGAVAGHFARSQAAKLARPQGGGPGSRRPQIVRRLSTKATHGLDDQLMSRLRYPAGPASPALRSSGRRSRAFPHPVTVLVAVISVLAQLPARAGPPSSVDSWVLPVTADDPAVVRGFDPPAQPWLAGHRGVDLSAPPGTPVVAAGRGVVTYAGMLAGRGVVAVSHGELRTTYEPVTSVVVVGEHVDTGQPIGTLATVGGHCLPATCLHWGLRRGEEYLDPLELLRDRVRLLPLGSEAVTAPGARVPRSPSHGPDRRARPPASRGQEPAVGPLHRQPAGPLRSVSPTMGAAAAAGRT